MEKKKENNVKKKRFDLNKNKVKIMVLALIGVLLLSSGISFAYFSANITNGNNGTAEVVTAGTMRITYSEGSYLNLENALPGASVYKEFSLENTGDIAAEYEIYLSELVNTFINNELKYTITSTEAGVNIENQTVPTTSSKIVNKQTIGVGETHNYRLTITFINDSEHAQNYNQGAQFSAKIGINEAKEHEYVANETILTSSKTRQTTVKGSLDEIYDLLD